ncbi:hypothetical protein [Bowmanella yangjiangensis]|uniref:DUF2059 domain-containing protein n=1 Tax=Bowmanella yangjiangensis TaxID=2811230 RepID=A0ABS3CPI4_9ALTE|nr:hypothetical protein [Bowmanella yangjiangensis]MBN7819004.1 hypothetical protein [Bowmanella yangjiangensis]
MKGLVQAGALIVVVGLLLWKPWSSDKSVPTGSDGEVTKSADSGKSAPNDVDAGVQAEGRADKGKPVAKPGSEFYAKREQLLVRLDAAKNCQTSGDCVSTEDDPRAGMFEQEKRLVEALQSIQNLYASEQFEDDELAAITGEYLASPLGRAQYQAVEMMQQQAPNRQNAETLLRKLDDSYDTKVMELALDELARYPELNESIDDLFVKNLRTGSFYVSRTIAEGITPYLNQDNLARYESTLAELPPQSAKARLLSAAIERYKKSSQ